MYRYSDRLPWRHASNALAELLAQVRESAHALLDLTGTNPTEALAGYPHHQIAAAFASAGQLRYQPDPLGMRSTREAIVQWTLLHNPGLLLDPSHLALTASTSEAYAVLFKLLANPGDEILVPSPSYPLFDCLADLESVKLVPYRLGYDGSWFLDFASLQNLITHRTRAVIVVNPNNPTGSFLKQSELPRLLNLACQHHLPLISDEVFADYTLADSPQYVRTLNGIPDILSFTLNGLSKCAAMPQMKLAWIHINGPEADRNLALFRLELILDTYLSVNTPVQVTAAQLLSIGDRLRAGISAQTRTNLDHLKARTARSAVRVRHVEAGWSAILHVPGIISEDEWVIRLLKEHQVVVQPGFFFDMRDGVYLIVSLLTDPAVFALGVERIIEFTAKVTQS